MADSHSNSSGPTPGQCDVLQFFAQAIPGTKRQANIVITQIFADPANVLRWTGERARRYLVSFEAPRRAPDDPQDSHTVVFNATRALVHGFGLTPEQARPLLTEYLQRSDLPWFEHEVDHKLRSVDAQPAKFPRGYLRGDGPALPSATAKQARGQMPETAARQKVEFDPAKLAELAQPWNESADLVFLANRSAVDPATVTPAGFLEAMYGAGEKVLCFTDYYSQGEAVWPAQPPPATGPLGVWFLPQPVCGEARPNPEGKPTKDGEVPMSRRTHHCVTAFRYLLLESDKAKLADWLGFIVQVPLRIEALYTSGGRSIHALVRVDCLTKGQWDEEKRALMPFLMGCVMVGGDRGVLSAVRLSRLPGCLREGKEGEDGRNVRFPAARPQKLLYLRPGADDRPICELPARRDVVETWTARARLAVDGHEEDLAALRAGLGYYANVSKPCAAALADVEGMR